MNLIEFKKEFDPLLLDFIENKITEISKDKDLKFLEDNFNYLNKFISGGKRVRPYMAYLSYSSFDQKADKKILSLFIFLEVFHYFCLIHDDIMDNSDTRHGLNTLNKEFGDSTAILIGDYLFSWSWEIINNYNLEQEKKDKLTHLFSGMIEEVFLGQAIDINLDSNKKISDDLILKKTLLKTAGYTFTYPMLIGLLLSGMDNQKNTETIEKIGENLGLAFQIQDDLLDITSDFDGKKKPLSDIEEGKHTLISNYVFENGSEDQKQKFEKIFGKEVENIEEIREIFYDSGAVSFFENLINEYFQEAKKFANKNMMILELIDVLENRKS